MPTSPSSQEPAILKINVYLSSESYFIERNMSLNSTSDKGHIDQLHTMYIYSIAMYEKS